LYVFWKDCWKIHRIMTAALALLKSIADRTQIADGFLWFINRSKEYWYANRWLRYSCINSCGSGFQTSIWIYERESCFVVLHKCNEKSVCAYLYPLFLRVLVHLAPGVVEFVLSAESVYKWYGMTRTYEKYNSKNFPILCLLCMLLVCFFHIQRTILWVWFRQSYKKQIIDFTLWLLCTQHQLSLNRKKEYSHHYSLSFSQRSSWWIFFICTALSKENMISLVRFRKYFLVGVAAVPNLASAAGWLPIGQSSWPIGN